MFVTSNPMAAAFAAAKNTAANVPQTNESGEYTSAFFLADFPQFTDASGGTLVPSAMLELFVTQANDSVLPSRWGTMWRYAAGLYVAHFSAMYLKTYADSSASAAEAATGAEQTGVVKRAQMGDTSIEYDASAVTQGTAEWGAWNLTQYGQMLVTLARSVGMGGMYCI
jgi:hypothetical protein